LASFYSEVPPGELLAIGSSWETLEIAVNRGNAAQLLGAERGTPIIARSREQS